MVVENVERRIMDLAFELKIPEINNELLSQHTWQAILKANGAEQLCDYDNLSESIKIVPSGKIVALTRDHDGVYYTLVQVHNNDDGNNKKSNKQISFPGGACKIWGRNKINKNDDESSYEYIALEPQVLAALREWQEKIKVQFNGRLYMLACTYTTEYKQDTAPMLFTTIFYGSFITLEEMRSYACLRHGIRKKIKMIKIANLKKYIWDSDEAEVFERIVKSYAPES